MFFATELKRSRNYFSVQKQAFKRAYRKWMSTHSLVATLTFHFNPKLSKLPNYWKLFLCCVKKFLSREGFQKMYKRIFVLLLLLLLLLLLFALALWSIFGKIKSTVVHLARTCRKDTLRYTFCQTIRCLSFWDLPNWNYLLVLPLSLMYSWCFLFLLCDPYSLLLCLSTRHTVIITFR